MALLKQTSVFSCHCEIIPGAPYFPQSEKAKMSIMAKKGLHTLALFYLSRSFPPCSATQVPLLFPEELSFAGPQDQAVLFPQPGLFFPPPDPHGSFTHFLLLLLRRSLLSVDFPVHFFKMLPYKLALLISPSYFLCISQIGP